MAITKGNYWLSLLHKEKKIRKEIECVIETMIGMKFKDYSSMVKNVSETIKDELEMYSVKNRMGNFNIEYDFTLEQKNNVLCGYTILYVRMDDESFDDF